MHNTNVIKAAKWPWVSLTDMSITIQVLQRRMPESITTGTARTTTSEKIYQAENNGSNEAAAVSMIIERISCTDTLF